MTDLNPFEHLPIAWHPTPEVIEKAQLTRFMRQVGIESFDELMRRSTEDVEWFTGEVLKFLDIRFDPPYEKLMDTSRGIEWTRWCTGGGLNISEVCLDRWMGTEVENQPAIIWEGEDGEIREISYAELLKEVEYCAAGLRANGIGKGDAVGIHLPMMIETVVALIAIARIGAIAVPVFSGYGVDAIASRFNAVGAKAFISCMGFPRRGKPVWAHMTAWEAALKCTDLKKGIILDSWSIHHATLIEKEIKLKEEQQEKARKFLEENPQYKNQTGAVNFNTISVGEKKSLVPTHIDGFAWNDLIKVGKEKSDELAAIEPTLAEDPLIILYTSGTTGKPKGIAHVHCGFPIKAAQDMAFGTDVGRGTRISWVTDIGWMMGPWLIYGALINGATMVLYDGAPDYPAPDRMWEFCARHKVEILGISPTLVRALATCGDDLPKKHDLSSLRAFASTGEPWNPDPWRWLFEKVGDSKLPIINYSGGTEISGGILMGNPLLPIKPCSFPAPCPGISADVLDENGQTVKNGKVGELAIRQPWIGMARGFWQEDERYLDTYWRRFPGIWVHGDWALRDEDGHWFILGRSDDTLKVAGKRVGPAEVESLLVAHPLVTEAAVIGVPDELKGTAMVAFCVLTQGNERSAGSLPAMSAERENDPESDAPADAGATDSAAFVAELKALVAKDMGKPLTPGKIHFVSALPKTRNAKVMRRVIRSAYLGEDPGDLSALENPQAVEEIKGITKQN